MIDIKQQHRDAIESGVEIFHQFLQKYNKKKTVYTFYEGRDDTSYYNTFVENSFPSDCRHEYFICNNRISVFNTYKQFDWSRFSKINILFFVDRDFSDFLLNNEIITDENIYLSDGYSIENNLVSEHNLRRLLKEVYNLHNLSDEAMICISNLYKNAENEFVNFVFPLMAYIICWHNEGYNPQYTKIKVKKLYYFESGKFIKTIELSDFITAIEKEYSYKIKKTSSEEVEKKILKLFDKRSMIRGKYFLEFFINYLNSTYNDIEKIVPNFKKDKKHINISESNAILILGPRLKIPESLREFIENKVKAFEHFNLTPAST